MYSEEQYCIALALFDKCGSVTNMIQRNFHADYPNEKWLTDITEFSIPAGKVYLSPMIDCFDGMPVSWRISVSPNGEPVNGMLEDAIIVLCAGEKPILHTDRGCHYCWPGWIQRMNRTQLRRSMSQKGCSPDNAACTDKTFHIFQKKGVLQNFCDASFFRLAFCVGFGDCCKDFAGICQQ